MSPATRALSSIVYPSGLVYQVLPCVADDERDVILLGDLVVPVYATRDAALVALVPQCDEHGYLIQPKGKTRIQLWRDGQSLLLHFDNVIPYLFNVEEIS